MPFRYKFNLMVMGFCAAGSLLCAYCGKLGFALIEMGFMIFNWACVMEWERNRTQDTTEQE